MSCPICGDDVSQKYRPFCSRRCADIDLSRWLNGTYAIPTEDSDNAETLENDPNNNPDRRH